MSKSIITLVVLISGLLSQGSLLAQFPARYNFGGSNGSCGDFSGASTQNILTTGNIPYEPGVAIISGTNIEIYDPNGPISGAGKNECMYQNELYGKHNTDLIITYCGLPVGQDLDFTLHFAEIYFDITGPGQRMFDILIDGNLKQANFDNWAEGNILNGGLGGNNVAVDKGYTITVGASGCVEILLRSIGVENARINGITIDEAATSFPVEMLTFEAEKGPGNTAILSWSTASELNNAGFEIQYSSDNVNFEVGGFVPGFGTTTEVQEYQFNMEGLDPGRYAFRLRQIDYDGAYDYSRKVELTLPSSDDIFVSNIYPNPASDVSYLNISVAERQAVTVKLYHIDGRELGTVFRGVLNPDEMEEVSIATKPLIAGVYLVVANGLSFRKSMKLIIQ